MFGNIFILNKKNKHFFKEDYFKKNFNDYYQEIIIFCNKNNLNDLNFKLKIYHFLHNLSTIPKCECGKNLNFKNFTKGYRKFCSNNCVNKSEVTKLKIKENHIKKYGVDNPSKIKTIKDKGTLTFIKNYEQNKVKEKREQTNLKKYGVKNPFQSQKIKDKIVDSNLKKYGVKYPFQSEKIKNKIKETLFKKYGVLNASNIPHNKSKRQENNLNLLIKKLDSDYKFISHDQYETFIFNHNKCNKNFTISRELLNLRYSRKHEICTVCNNINDLQSINEKEIIEFISSLGVKCDEKNKTIIPPYEIDIFIKERDLGVEYNGLYFHSSKFKDKMYHFNKWLLANNKDINLIQIFEDEWLFKKDIVKSIIKNKLGVGIETIYGRKCKIRELNNKEYQEFLNKNHIQGYTPSSIKIGLIYKNEIVSVLGLSSKRIVTNSCDIYEITRFCNKLDCRIIGGFSKIINYVTKNLNIKNIITFSDIRFFDGLVYEKAGFNFKYITPPNYWYFDNKDHIRYHRYKFAKHKLIKMGCDPKLTESEIMSNTSFLKIWDCGSMKWELKI